MATSSIFANFNINDSRTAEAFVEALETSANDPKRTPTAPVEPLTTDTNEIREFFKKRNKKASE